MFHSAVHKERTVKGIMGVMGAMAATASLVAAAAIRRRRLASQEAQHPLKGSVQRRINLFGALANRRRGAQAEAATEDYQEAPEDVV